ncbi:MAG: hypothetical protein HN353_12320 [Bdellovibrionales bacterium]|nr:hypothetical protein [Bdellovibrionales bacterium]MBT3526300.1 hypothetical protein [Bdellovibrionales bacterium]MBT7668877.1 hypothetical protein [Bdellovibrionales bacterium]MBT7767848.1 hypothetical protein [Bdellovibrionales bacterium]
MNRNKISFNQGHIDNSMTFIIVAILGSIALFSSKLNFPDWLKIAGIISISIFLLIGIISFFWGFKGLGRNLDDKDL